MLIWSKIRQNHWLILSFLFIFILRFVQVGERFHFGIDEEYQSLLGLSLIKDFRPIWIGTSQADTGFYLGPGFVYLHALLLKLSNLDPLILAYSASLLGFLIAVALYYTTRQLFNSRVALISLIIYAGSAFILTFDRRFWNPSPIPLISILFFWAYQKSLNDSRWYVLIALLLAGSFHVHASLLIYLPITIYIILTRLKKKSFNITFKTGLLSLIVFLALYFPLIVFDVVHNFDNLLTPVRLLSRAGSSFEPGLMFRHLQIMISTLANFILFINLASIFRIAVFLILVIINIHFLLTAKGLANKILKIIQTFYFIMFLFYPGTINDYYYLGWLPFQAIVLAQLMCKLKLLPLVMLLLVYISVNTAVFVNRPLSGNLLAKKALVQKVSRYLDSRPFYLETDRDYLYFGGWRYLFEAYGQKPAASQADSMFGWIYPTEISSQKPRLKVIVSENKVKLLKESKITITSKPFTANILKD